VGPAGIYLSQSRSARQPRTMARGSDRWFRSEHLTKGLGRRATRGAAFTLGAQAGQLVVGLLATAVLARLLTPPDFGLVGMVLAITGLISLVGDLGMSTATIQREQIDHAQVTGLFWINIVLGFVLALLTALLAPGVAWFYGEPKLTGITLVLAAGFVASGASVQHMALLRRSMLFGRVVAVQFAAQVAAAVTAIVMAAWGAGYWALVGRTLAAPLVSFVGFWLLCDWRPSLFVRGTPLRELLRFGGHLTGFSLLNYFGRNADNILIGRFHGTHELAIYEKGYGLFMMPLQQVNGPAGAVTIPALSRLASDPERYRKAYLRVLEKVTLVSTLIAAFTIGTADWLVAVLLGSQWTETSGILRALALSALVQPISNTTGWLFISQGRSRELFRWGIIGTSVSILSFVVGLRWGALGVALAYSIGGIILRLPLLIWLVTRSGPVRARHMLGAAGPAILASVVGLVAVLGVRRRLEHLHPAVATLVAGCVMLAVSLAVLGATARGRAVLSDFKSLVRDLRGSGRRGGPSADH
jgi:O-antigen/teichoic acid export membrane protein